MQMLKHHAAFLQRAMAAPCALETKEALPGLSEIATLVENIGTAFDEYKSTNDERLKQIELKGAADPVTEEKLGKIDTALTGLDLVKKGLEKLEADFERKKSQPGSGQVNETPEALEHKQAFTDFLRDPSNPDLARKSKAAALAHAKALGLEGKAVDTLTGGAGGHGVPEVISRNINKRMLEVSDVRRVVKVVSAGSPDYKELVDTNGLGYGWVGETDARPETATANLEEVAPTFGSIYAYPKASEESLQDIFFDVEDWIVQSVLRSFAKGEGAAVIAGDGSKKPTGFLNGVPVATDDDARAFGILQYLPGGAANVLTDADALTRVVYTLKQQYRQNAVWMMNSLTTGAVRTLKDANGQYLWQQGLRLGEPSTLLGYTAETMEDMPDVAADSFPIAFGDFMSGYVLVDLAGLSITRDEVTSPGYVKWYVRKRIGGHLLDDHAIKLLKIATS